MLRLGVFIFRNYALTQIASMNKADYCRNCLLLFVVTADVHDSHSQDTKQCSRKFEPYARFDVFGLSLPN